MVSSEPAGHKPPMTPSRVMSPGQTGAPDSPRPQKICLCLGFAAFFRAVVPHGGVCISIHPISASTGLSVSPVHFMLKLFKIFFKETVLEEEGMQTIQSPSNHSLRQHRKQLREGTVLPKVTRRWAVSGVLCLPLCHVENHMRTSCQAHFIPV